VTNSIHDDVYRKVNHVSRGLLHSLLTEISHALVVTGLDEVPTLRLELYGATMQKDAGSELQAWISFVVERADKLEFLKKPVEDAELTAIFLKGLVPTFNQLQVAFAIPGSYPKKFTDAVATTRKFAANPTVAAELDKLKSRGQSQSMFLATSQVPAAPKPKSQILCRLFASTGQCRFGSQCKFVHTATPATSQLGTPNNENNSRSRPCGFCEEPGHAEDNCRLKQKLLAQLRSQQTTLATTANSADLQTDDTTQEQQEDNDATRYQFVFTTTTATATSHLWVMDSGASCCATFSETDCIDVRDCNVKVTAGSSFNVRRMGTAVINTVDAKGRPVQLKMQDTLISPKFPLKLLALQRFTSREMEVHIGKNEMRIMGRLRVHCCQRSTNC
jgi:hypothetical protein